MPGEHLRQLVGGEVGESQRGDGERRREGVRQRSRQRRQILHVPHASSVQQKRVERGRHARGGRVVRVAVQRAAQRVHRGERGEEGAAAELLPVAQKDLTMSEEKNTNHHAIADVVLSEERGGLVDPVDGARRGEEREQRAEEQGVEADGAELVLAQSRRCSI